jgi:plasmid stabilization system protein ParE
VIGITAPARGQIDALFEFYLITKDRPDAALRLVKDLATGRGLILANPTSGLAYPGPYRRLGHHGFLWRRVRIYWFAWSLIETRPVVTNVLHAAADIEGRVTSTIDGITEW